VDAAISAFAALGLKVMITELDVDVLPMAFKSSGADISLSADLQPKLNPSAKGLPRSMPLFMRHGRSESRR
jgi:endo-1,4-beta-xylanase